MSDSLFNTYERYGTNAERLAFVPDPPPTMGGAVQPIYTWYATDTGITWVYDTSWHSISGPGGAIPSTAQGDILYASGTNTLAALAKNASATRYLSNTGSSNNPAWAQVNLTNGVTGVLPVANGGTGVSADFVPMLKSTTPLTNANVIALPGTPITLVSAPGAGFRIKLLAPVTLISDFSAGAYTGLDTTYATLNVQTPAGSWLTCAVANDNTLTTPLSKLTSLFSAFDRVVDLPIPAMDAFDAGNAGGASEWIIPVVSTDPASLDNDAVVLYLDNNGSVTNLGGGNAANTLKVVVYYAIEALT